MTLYDQDTCTRCWQSRCLRRAGHTEAAVDLARMAGLAPQRLLRVLDEQGERATRDRLAGIAKEKNLKISIEQLIAHRRVSEKLISRDAESELPTKYGKFQIIVFGVQYEAQSQSLVFGDLTASGPPPFGTNAQQLLHGDLESLRCDCGDQFHIALKMISREGEGHGYSPGGTRIDWLRKTGPTVYRTMD